jgi:hypothetical protein
MHNCFFDAPMHAVLLLRNGHGDQLASDIAGFITDESQLDPNGLGAMGMLNGH